MGFFKVLKDLKEFIFSSKKNVILTLILGIIVLSIPFSLQLIESQKVIRSRADEPEICQTDPTSIDCRCNNSSSSDDWDPIGSTQCSSQCNLRLVKYRNVCEGNREQEFAELYDLACTNGCTTTSTPPPGAGSCDIDSKQTPSVGDQCASCINTNNSGLISGIRSSIPSSKCSVGVVSSKTDTQLINYWCNGGISQGAQQDCLNKKTTCGSVCGAAATGDCRPDLANLSITPSSAAAGSQIVFQASGSQGTAYIEEDYGGGANNCTFLPEPSIPRDTYTCKASSTPGSYTWTHKWRNSEGGTLCQKPQIYTITAATTNNATCGTFKINNSTDQTTLTAGSQFDISLIMNNPTGSKTWRTSENYRLAKVDGDWALPDVNRDRVSLPTSEISAGNTATFNFRLTAPNTAGSFPINLRMVQDGVEFFGATCSKSITVGAAVTPSPSPSPRTSPSPQPPVTPACIRGDLDGNKCISPGFSGNDFQTWLRVVTGQDSGKADVFPPCAGDGRVDINDFNLWLIESLRPGNPKICR